MPAAKQKEPVYKKEDTQMGFYEPSKDLMGDNLMSAFDPLGAGKLLDQALFGRPASTEVIEGSLLTPEQEEMMKRLIAQGPINQEENLSLAGVEAMRNQIATGDATTALSSVAGRANDPEARKEYFETASQPLVDQAQENLKAVGREFSGGAGGFFGSERATQDENVQSAFADAQAQLMSNLIREDEDRALKAATGLQAGEQMQLGAAQTTAQNELALQQLYQQLLGVQGKENIVLNQGGTDGNAAGIAGGVMKMMSDRRLKTNIKSLFKHHSGIEFVTWNWKSSGRPSLGVIAQDVAKILPEAVSKIGEYFCVDLWKVLKLVSKDWTRGEV